MRLAAVLLLFLAVPAPGADPPPRAKVELSPKDGAWVGQRVTFAVTLYAPDLFAGVPSFEMPSIPGAVVVPPAGSAVVGSERVGDTTFTTQRHEFAIYAQRPEVVRIPAFVVRFETNAGFGKPTIQRQVTTEAVSFTAKAPPGTDGLGTVIAARNLKVSDEWNPQPKAAKVGDAFTRTLTVTADDVSGMVFPSFRVDAIDGLSAYPRPPAVTDRTERGSLTGQRVEAVTYVCEKPGTVTVPDRTLTWWDLDLKELRTVKLPGRTLEVVPDPKATTDPTPAAAAPGRTGRGWWWLVAAVGVVAVGWVLFARVRPWWARHRAAVADSEAAYFARFRRACRSPDPHAVYVALLKWLDRVGPVSLAEFVTRAGDPVLAEVVTELQNQVYARPDSVGLRPWLRAGELLTHTAVARRRFRSAARSLGTGASLPPLNPDGFGELRTGQE